MKSLKGSVVMKKKISMIFVLICILTTLFMIGCGEGSEKEKSPYEGKWIAVSAQMMGMSLDAEEAFGETFQFEVKNDGKASISIGEDTGKGKWSVNEEEITLTIDGEEMIGVIEENTIVFDDMLGTGMKIIFAKEGTDAMNPDLYQTEE